MQVSQYSKKIKLSHDKTFNKASASRSLMNTHIHFLLHVSNRYPIPPPSQSSTLRLKQKNHRQTLLKMNSILLPMLSHANLRTHCTLNHIKKSSYKTEIKGLFFFFFFGNNLNPKEYSPKMR